SRASSFAISPGAVSPESFCTARSSMPAGTASNGMPAFLSSICRAWLCEARINGSFSSQMLMAPASFRKPLPLPVGEQFQNRGCGFLDRPPRHVELHPAEFGAQTPCIGNFIGDGLAIDIIVIAGLRAHAQQPVLPDL